MNGLESTLRKEDGFIRTWAVTL